MSKLTDLLDKATPRPWRSWVDKWGESQIGRSPKGPSFIALWGASYKQQANRETVVALVNNAEAIQALWDAAQDEVAYGNSGYADEPPSEALMVAVEALRDLCGDAS